jgi:hypothetical protein
MTTRVGAIATLAVLLLTPAAGRAQLSDPCGAGCGVVLGATSFVVAQGTATAVGRARGGFSTTTQGIVAWGAGFALAAGGGIALSGNGERQERAVYAAGVGVLAGSLAGLTVGALSGDGGSARRVAATFVGGAIGALAGGVLGAITWDGDASGTGAPVPLTVLSLPVGF